MSEHIHFIGIGGVSMSGLAEVMRRRGLRVSGSDPHPNEATARLQAAGVAVYSTQTAETIGRERPSMVVVTAAIPQDNPELVEARRQGIPVVGRAEFLGRLLAEFRGPRIGIAGTHGKTTTTAMVAEVLIEAGLDPTVLIGGEYAPFGGNLRLGAGDCVVTEACEAYSSFLSLDPDVAVITNVEADHLDHYGTLEGVYEAFEQFVRRLSRGGLIAWCSDDHGATHVVDGMLAGDDMHRRVAYGLKPHGESSVWARSIQARAGGTTFKVLRTPSACCDAVLGRLHLQVPGEHNVRNALAAVAVALHLGIPFDVVSRGLQRFRGAGRRFEVLGEVAGVAVVDDYAHHPTEIRATLASARSAYPDRRIVATFQPHLYSRTRDFMDEFAVALSDADVVVVTDIYAAREGPMEGVHASDLAARVQRLAPDRPVRYAGPLASVPAALDEIAEPGDVLLTLGAGDIRAAAEAFLRDRQARQGSDQGSSA